MGSPEKGADSSIASDEDSFTQDGGSYDSQVVTYGDPAAASKRMDILERAAGNLIAKPDKENIRLELADLFKSTGASVGSKIVSTTSKIATSTKPAQTSPAKKLHKAKHHFTFTGFPELQKLNMVKVIEELGGICSEQFEVGKISHLIACHPSHSEKYLCACAAGIWIMRPSYFEECKAKKTLVDETAHEWSLKYTSEAKTDHVLKWMGAPPRCRGEVARQKYKKPQGVTDRKYGMFSGKTVLMHVSSIEKGVVFKRILECGGAIVVQCKPPFDNLGDLSSQVTHAFVALNSDHEVYKQAITSFKIPMLTFEDMQSILTGNSITKANITNTETNTTSNAIATSTKALPTNTNTSNLQPLISIKQTSPNKTNNKANNKKNTKDNSRGGARTSDEDSGKKTDTKRKTTKK